MVKKIGASTLLEVIIAMVIIMVVFAIALKVFANLFYSGVSQQKVQVQHQLNVLAQQVKDRGYVSEEVMVLDSVTYQLYADTTAIESLAKLEIKAVKRDKLLGKINCLFKTKVRATEN